MPAGTGAAPRVTLTGVTASASGRVALTPCLPALRTVTYAGRASTRTTFTLGLSDRLDFPVFALSTPTRVVVDLAQPITGPFTQKFATAWGTLGGDGHLPWAALDHGGAARPARPDRCAA
ncbi:MAG: hypothetical protein WAL50_15960 [Kineosporiaceae bacterium]